MNVLSLFDGISCGRVALDRENIDVTNYYASEVDKYAITITQANWPQTIQLGDVTKWREWGIDWTSIDLLIGGSPCQGFSFAGKRLAFDDPRSALFFVYVDILNHIKSLNPDVKFLLENVKMKKEYLDIISSFIGTEPVLINSSLVSAQNRKRYYWASWNIKQPEDKKILLKDIIDYSNLAITIMSDKFTNRQKGRKCLVNEPKEKAASFSAMEYVKNGRQGDYVRCDGEGTCNVFIHLTPRGNNPGGLRAIEGKTPAITTNSWEQNNHLIIGNKYRKLTPIEAERLQTLGDDYTNHVSNTQRYKGIGNGWTVDVIAHIFKAGSFAQVIEREQLELNLGGVAA